MNLKKNKGPKKLVEIPVRATTAQSFRIFGDTQPLLTAGTAEKFNTMTIGWGGLGTLWGMPVCSVYVRPSRYTYEFMESGEFFTVSFFPENMKDRLAVCGTMSGRDVDKVAEAGLTPVFDECGAPYFDEAGTVLVCRKVYVQDVDLSGALDDKIGGFYSDGDVHRMYVGEVIKVLTK
jgi:flavin reductase (DIM6/NTAB) family NADH-FMN oxidoreductase RutF